VYYLDVNNTTPLPENGKYNITVTLTPETETPVSQNFTMLFDVNCYPNDTSFSYDTEESDEDQSNSYVPDFGDSFKFSKTSKKPTPGRSTVNNKGKLTIIWSVPMITTESNSGRIL
jgi:hypothetical protein